MSPLKIVKPHLVVLGAFAVTAAAGCAAPSDRDADDDDSDRDGVEEPVSEQSAPLRIGAGGGTQGGDPDECMATLAACYQSCAKSGSASCYRYCDIVYSQCRGLPPPELTISHDVARTARVRSR